MQSLEQKFEARRQALQAEFDAFKLKSQVSRLALKVPQAASPQLAPRPGARVRDSAGVVDAARWAAVRGAS